MNKNLKLRVTDSPPYGFNKMKSSSKIKHFWDQSTQRCKHGPTSMKYFKAGITSKHEDNYTLEIAIGVMMIASKS